VTSWKIGLVDDDLSVRRALPRLLRSEGYAPRVFASARELLDSGFAAEADCLILDIHLGGTSGLDLLEQLRAAAIRTPVVMITAHDDVAARERSRRNGAAAYLKKPFEPASFLDAIASAIAAGATSSGIAAPPD
jgi:FixJ family two-component response regulator